MITFHSTVIQYFICDEAFIVAVTISTGAGTARPRKHSKLFIHNLVITEQNQTLHC